MGPRGDRLHCTKRHFWVLMRSLCQDGKTRERWGEMVVKHGWKLKWQDRHGWHQWGFPPSPCCQVLILLQSSGSDASASARPEKDNMSRLLTDQAKAIQTSLSLFYENMQSLNVCYSQCVTSFLCLFTHSLLVMCLWYVLVYIALQKVCVCGCGE